VSTNTAGHTTYQTRGTTRWSAPERLDSQRLEELKRFPTGVDIYAFACTIVEVRSSVRRVKDISYFVDIHRATAFCRSERRRRRGDPCYQRGEARATSSAASTSLANCDSMLGQRSKVATTRRSCSEHPCTNTQPETHGRVFPELRLLCSELFWKLGAKTVNVRASVLTKLLSNEKTPRPEQLGSSYFRP
jgi:hypothetical protein